MPCRINFRRIWSHRILLESLCHHSNSFLTLTYDEEHLPIDGSLIPRHTQLWLKRFREVIKPVKFRYFLVGEYGDLSQRPHYHAALFGVGPEQQDIVRETWGMGHVFLGDLTLQSAQYIAGYVTKKMTSKSDSRLNGRHPEFSRMSLRPGIGATAVPSISSSILDSLHGCKLLSDLGDVPTSLNHGTRSLPLGRYLRQKLREEIGYEKDTEYQKIRKSDERFIKESSEMLLMYSTWLKAEKIKDSWPAFYEFKEVLKNSEAQKVLNMESRFKIYNQKGVL